MQRLHPDARREAGVHLRPLCINLPHTMAPQEAADAVKAFRPRIFYPYHYRGSDTKAFAEALKGEKEIEVRLRDWY